MVAPDAATKTENPVARILLPWCMERLERAPKRPWVLGLQGAQGCGKSTAAAAVVESVRRRGLRAETVSIDDFYLTREEQVALAARHAGNPYLLHRGYPGTHDIALGVRTLDALAANQEGSEVLLPTYDKAAHGGRGDRAPAGSGRRVVGRPDLVIVEGWMLGFAPVDERAIAPELVAPNRYLADYRAWTERLDALVHLSPPSPEAIVAWRVDAERARRERGEGALSDAEATDYILRFLPAYEVYVPVLRARPPCTDFLSLTLAADRKPVATRDPA
jgi:D-glycerate 3-kinase